jgi:hypothetical protein
LKRSPVTSRSIRLELLRARAAASRVDLALEIRDLTGQLAPVRKAVDLASTLAAALKGRVAANGRPVRVGAAFAAAVRRAPGWLRAVALAVGITLLVRGLSRRRASRTGTGEQLK